MCNPHFYGKENNYLKLDVSLPIKKQDRKPVCIEGMNESLTHKIKLHRTITPFNYDMTVDWALELLNEEVETENILILASFSKPVDSEEIQPYVSAVLNDLGIDEKAAIENPLAYINFYIDQIRKKQNIRINLKEMNDLCVHYDYKFGLSPFYLLHYAWQDLETEGFNFYYEKATLDNIEEIACIEAREWSNKYV